MGVIYYILGKSSCGKDTVYRRLLNDSELCLKSIVLYTTRPMREGERDGVSYHFTSEECFEQLKEKGLVIEDRVYSTVHGPWRYFTVKDFSIDAEGYDYLVTGVLSSYLSTAGYFGRDRVIPIYIEVDDGVRLERALKRELKPENRKFREMCRRFLSDDEDFSEEKLESAGITKRFINDDLNRCTGEIRNYILERKTDGYKG